MKIIFFGTSEIGVPILEQLVTHHKILAVVSSPDKPVGRKQILSPSPIANFAERKNLLLLKPTKVKNNPEFLEELSKFGADIFIVVSYGKILPEEMLDIPRLKTINVHFSLLPKYRGPAPVQFALLHGETETGTTIFILDKEVDHGPILATKKMSIDPSDTNITLQSKLAQLSADLLIDLLPKYDEGKIIPTKQNHTEASTSKIIGKEDGLIDWSQTAQDIYNRYRAFQPWPGIYTNWQGKAFKILNCEIAQNPPKIASGEAVEDLVGCGQYTALRLISVQLEGKNPVSIKDFLNGYPDFTHSQLN